GGADLLDGKDIVATALRSTNPPAAAFDGVYGGNEADEGWYSNNYVSGIWLQVQLTNAEDAIAPAAYALHGYPANFNYSARSPRGWTLYGSNDGSDWTELHSVTGYSDWSPYGELHEFVIGE